MTRRTNFPTEPLGLGRTILLLILRGTLLLLTSVVGPIVLLAAFLAGLPGSQQSTGDILGSWVSTWLAMF